MKYDFFVVAASALVALAQNWTQLTHPFVCFFRIHQFLYNPNDCLYISISAIRICACDTCIHCTHIVKYFLSILVSILHISEIIVCSVLKMYFRLQMSFPFVIIYSRYFAILLLASLSITVLLRPKNICTVRIYAHTFSKNVLISYNIFFVLFLSRFFLMWINCSVWATPTSTVGIFIMIILHTVIEHNCYINGIRYE